MVNLKFLGLISQSIWNKISLKLKLFSAYSALITKTEVKNLDVRLKLQIFS